MIDNDVSCTGFSFSFCQRMFFLEKCYTSKFSWSYIIVQPLFSLLYELFPFTLIGKHLTKYLLLPSVYLKITGDFFFSNISKSLSYGNSLFSLTIWIHFNFFKNINPSCIFVSLDQVVWKGFAWFWIINLTLCTIKHHSFQITMMHPWIMNTNA